MIASFMDPALHATFRCAPFPSSGIRAVMLHAINEIKSMMPHEKISICIRFGCLYMICLCGTNLGDADAKNNPSVMVAKCPILNYHVLVDDIL